MTPADATDLIIALDAGNSRIKMGLMSIDRGDVLPRCEEQISLDWSRHMTCGELHAWLDNFLQKWVPDPARVMTPSVSVIMAGSNLEAMEQVQHCWPARNLPVRIKRGRATFPLPIRVDSPERVGMDRLLNGLAASRLKPADHAAVIISSGTATTVDVIDVDGSFQGGAILPGMSMSALALHQYTSQLPHVDVSELAESAPRIIGKNTKDAMLNGILWGHLGAIHELVSQYSIALNSPVVCYLTGGAAPLLLPHLGTSYHHTPYLALQGLALWHWGENTDD
jgi:type III pantothenate kinase